MRLDEGGLGECVLFEGRHRAISAQRESWLAVNQGRGAGLISANLLLFGGGSVSYTHLTLPTIYSV